jgi:predicted enzyme related to lactoylglutathione lyase
MAYTETLTVREVVMTRYLGNISLLVADYDEAIRYFISKLDFTLLEDTPLGSGKRWVVVAPGKNPGCNLVLARATGAAQKKYIGEQGGGRVFLFLYTDNFQRDYKKMTDSGICFLEKPRCEPYGTVVQFSDLYGNKWDLLEPLPDPRR